jgi:tetratricopeptide (TPR) repeat protein
VLCLENDDLDGAQARIAHTRAYLNRILDRYSSTESPLQWRRQSLRADYYEAEIFFNRQDYARARDAYSRVLKRARGLGWSQFCAYATNWLADIALCERSYEAAETWLKQTHGYLAGQRDFRSLGFYHQSLARAYAGRDRHEEAHHSARHAANAFAQVGLLDRARTLLDEFNLT